MSYRDDAAALRLRLKSLEGELEELHARQGELAASVSRLAEVAADLAEVRSKLEEQQARRPLPLLDGVRVASPCNMRWDDMVGDGRVRYCGKCDKNVYNVAYMTRDEAETLIREHDGELCMRIHRRADGTVITSDCPVGARRRRRRNSAMAVALSGLAAGALYAAHDADQLEERASKLPVKRWVVTTRESHRTPVKTPSWDYAPVGPQSDAKHPRVILGKI